IAVLPSIGKRPDFTGIDFTPKELRETREKYLQYVIETSQYIDPRGIMHGRRSLALKLEQVYVSLNVEGDVPRRQDTDLLSALTILSEREREVLELRFGLKDGKDHTL